MMTTSSRHGLLCIVLVLVLILSSLPVAAVSNNAAEPSTYGLSKDVADERGYTFTAHQTYEFGGELYGQSLSVTAHATVYEKTTDADYTDTAMGVLSIPPVTVFGQNVNPVPEWSITHVASVIDSRDSNISAEHIGQTTSTVAGEQANVHFYRVEQTNPQTGETVELFAYVSMYQSDSGDANIVLAAHPWGDGEPRDSVLKTISHFQPVETPETA